MYCNNCEKDMMTNFKFCPVCGMPPQPPNNPTQVYGNPQNNPNPQNNYYQNSNPLIGLKSENTTLILSIVLGLLGLSGIGHMYVGKFGKGIVILIGSWILLVIGIALLIILIGVIFLIIALVLVIWQITDARKLCRQYNDHLKRTGTPPW